MGIALLDRYPVVHTRDRDVARERLFSAYGANGFEARGSGFNIQANYLRLRSIGLAFCSYDSKVTLSFPESSIVRQFFSIQGSAAFATAKDGRPIGTWSPLLPATSALQLDFESGYRQLVVRIEADALERSLKALLGDDSDRRLVFAGGTPNPRRMSFVRDDVFRLVEELDQFGQDYYPLVVTEMESRLILRYLLAHEHNFTDKLEHQSARANRSVVDLVEAFIETNWDKPIDVETLARVAKVSARTVFREFALSGRGSPTQFAKRVRLERAAQFLRHSDGETTVTGVALRCGFQNLGRFSSEYASLFGELPSVTLQRAKGRPA